MNDMVFDLHCDTALALLGDDLKPCSRLRNNLGHIDLTRGASLAGYAQCFAMFTFPGFAQRFHRPVTEVFQAMVSNLLRELEENRDLICQVFHPGQLRENLEQGKLSAILTLEGPAGIDYDPGRLEELYRLGFRMSTLGWNEDNPLVGSHLTGGGLTARGREYVRRCQELGILVDVSHVSDRGFWDILDITQAPIVASHSNLRSLCPSSRNLTDEMYRELAATGGTAGVNLYWDFVREHDATLDAAADHILRMLELTGRDTHISLGGDLDGCDPLVQGFSGVQDYPKLADVLLERGVPEQTIGNIYWNNAVGVMERAVRNHQK